MAAFEHGEQPGRAGADYGDVCFHHGRRSIRLCGDRKVRGGKAGKAGWTVPVPHKTPVFFWR